MTIYRTLDPEERDDAITDVARDMLAKGERLDRDGRYRECPSCDLWVHHTDLTTHVLECEPLRAKAAEVADA